MPDRKDRAQPDQKPGKDGSSWGLAFILALLMHAALFFGLFYVVQWTSESDEIIYAELWSPDTPLQDAPAEPAKPEEKAPEPEPEPGAENKPEPEPEPKPEPELPAPPPEPKPEPPAATEPPKAVPEEDAIGLAEKKKLEEERLEKERLEKERLEKERLEKERLEKERLEQERLEKERLEKERLEKERLEKQKAEERRRRAKELARQLRAEEMQHLEEAQEEASGRAVPKGVQNSTYASRVITMLHQRLNFRVTPDMRPGQYRAVYRISLLADGSQAGAPELVRSSGLKAFDLACERAIRATNFPPTDTHKPITIRVTFDPVEIKR